MFTDRVFNALKRLKRVYITWPDKVERVKISTKMASNHGLPGCFAVCGGTPAVLSQ